MGIRQKALSFLPDIPLNSPMWLQEWLSNVKILLQDLVGNENIPSQPTGLSVTAGSQGVEVTWVKSKSASHYRIWRNIESAAFSGATHVATVRDGDLEVYFDDQPIDLSDATGDAELYYWVQPFNRSIQGPLSESATASYKPSVTNSGTSDLEIKTTTANHVIFGTNDVSRWFIHQTDGSLNPNSSFGNAIGTRTTNAVTNIHMQEVLYMAEHDANPGTEMAEDAEIAIYTKADKFVIAYNNGGTVTYISIPLDGSTTTWTHSTSAP